MSATSSQVVIIGAGLAGLCCVRRLHQANIPCLLIEVTALKKAARGDQRPAGGHGRIAKRKSQAYYRSAEPPGSRY